jgi:hypothetical protein
VPGTPWDRPRRGPAGSAPGSAAVSAAPAQGLPGPCLCRDPEHIAQVLAVCRRSTWPKHCTHALRLALLTLIVPDYPLETWPRHCWRALGVRPVPWRQTRRVEQTRSPLRRGFLVTKAAGQRALTAGGLGTHHRPKVLDGCADGPLPRATETRYNHCDESSECGAFPSPKTCREAEALATRHPMGPDCSLQGQVSTQPCREHASLRKQGICRTPTHQYYDGLPSWRSPSCAWRAPGREGEPQTPPCVWQGSPVSSSCRCNSGDRQR